MMESLKRKFRYRLFRQNWNVGLIDHPVHVVAGLEGEKLQSLALEEIAWMDEVRGTFKADPFVAPSPVNGSELIVLYEHFDWPSNLGKICSAKWNGSSFEQPQLSLDSPHHLSYPYVYADNQRIFYIPEHAEGREVSRYEIDQDGKALAKTVMLPGCEFVDSTLVEHQGKFWIFATHAGNAVDSDLHIYFSDTLSGPWHPHSLNPVKSDRGNARPAGQPFHFKSAFFRPAQNSSRHYGENIVVNRIVTLSESEFVEVPESIVRAPSSWIYDFGLHTISHWQGRTVVDGARLESKFHPALDRLAALVR